MSIIKTLAFVLPIVAMSVPYAQLVASEKETVLDAGFIVQRDCLSLGLYHEARSESDLGQRAVGFVMMNRMKSSRYPKSVCGVVKQGKKTANGNMIKNKCQFSFYCDGASDKPKNRKEWLKAQAMAYDIMTTYGIVEDPTGGAVMYHADYVSPYWKHAYTRTSRIDSHIFYKEK
ncbi:MAG: cell wall hydrolase [Robiginitomaculum sp.]|nr:MAG: cell wall hydrolase [Robiginitomaculum sp.]